LLHNPRYDAITAPAVVRVPPRQVTGRNIAHGKRSPVERAILAADVIAGRVVITDLTQQQVMSLLRASKPYVAAARRLSRTERQAVFAGWRPLVVKPTKRSAPTPSDAETLANIVARHGVDAALEMIVAAEVTVTA
jgi:hypothetical protein